MKITERADGSLEIVKDDRVFGEMVSGRIPRMSGHGGLSPGSRPGDSEPIIGSIGGAAVFLAAFLGFLERSVFIFDGQQRMIDWRRGRPFSRARGRIAFDDVTSVFAETSADSEGNLTRRIVLNTGADLIPLTTACSGGPDGEYMRTAAKISMLLGHAATDAVTGCVLGFIKTGREIDAIRLVRADRGTSLGDAKDVVAHLRESVSR